MTRTSRLPRQREAASKGVLKKPRSVRFVTVMAFVLPGSGQVFNGAPFRGVIMQFGMVFGAFITYMLTTPDISPVGRMAGGLLVYVFSIVDANGIAKLRVKAWERIEAGEPPRQRRGMAQGAPVKGSATGSRKKKGVPAPVGTAPVGKKGRPNARSRGGSGSARSGEGRRAPAEPAQQARGPGEADETTGPGEADETTGPEPSSSERASEPEPSSPERPPQPEPSSSERPPG